MDKSYTQWVQNLVKRYRQCQIKAAIKVNEEQLRFNWLLGHDIEEMRVEERWGEGVIAQLSKDLKKEMPQVEGLSVTNLRYCRRFYLLYSQCLVIRPQIEGEFPGNVLPSKHPQVGGDLSMSETSPLVLVVEYNPEEPISVKLSRKMNVAKALEAKQIMPASPKAGTPVSAPTITPIAEPHEPTKQVVNHTKGLKVTFRDGTVISERTANNTLIRVLQKIGLAKVASANIKHGGGYGLVSKTMRPPEAGRTWQHQVGEYYVYTNTSNQQKKDDLRKLSDLFGLGMVIEDGK